MIQDTHGVVHEVAGDDTLCGECWYHGDRRLVRGWGWPAALIITCFSCIVRRIAWLD